MILYRIVSIQCLDTDTLCQVYRTSLSWYVYVFVGSSEFLSINQSSIIGLSGILGPSYVGAVMTRQVRGSHDPHCDVT